MIWWQLRQIPLLQRKRRLSALCPMPGSRATRSDARSASSRGQGWLPKAPAAADPDPRAVEGHASVIEAMRRPGRLVAQLSPARTVASTRLKKGSSMSTVCEFQALAWFGAASANRPGRLHHLILVGPDQPRPARRAVDHRWHAVFQRWLMEAAPPLVDPTRRMKPQPGDRALAAPDSPVAQADAAWIGVHCRLQSLRAHRFQPRPRPRSTWPTPVAA